MHFEFNMNLVWVYAILSVVAVSLISLIGILTLLIKTEKLKNILLLFVSFSAGGLFGAAFIHLLPEAVNENGFSLLTGLFILAGITFSFLVEKLIHWRHCHLPVNEAHIHPLSLMSLVGDAIHNFIDGLIIGTSYLVSIPLGIASTIAVVFHEIPQEIGDMGVLLYGGFSKKKALLFNFLTALTAILGTLTIIIIGNYVKNINFYLIPFAVGTFIYIAGSDMIPELHKEFGFKKSIMEISAFILGIGIMLAMFMIE